MGWLDTLGAMLLPGARADSEGDIEARPDAWTGITGLMRQTASGQSVTPGRANALSAYFAAIRCLSEDVAKLPLKVYRRLEPRGKQPAPTHPLYPVLHTRANPEMSAIAFRETLMEWALGWGNGYAEIVRDGMGQARELWPIHPSRVEVKRNASGALVYRVRAEYDPLTGQSGITTTDLPAADVFHLHGLGGNGLTGYSIAQLAAESIGVGLAQQTAAATLFANGTLATGVLEHPGKLSPEARKNLRETWRSIYGGAKNTGKTAILEEGMKFNRLTIPPDEAQFLESRGFQVVEIARWFRVPPHKLQDLSRATFSNIEQQSLEYVGDTLMPWLVRFEQEAQAKLLPGDDAHFVAFVLLGLLRGDANARANYFRTMVNIGAMSPNDVREAEDLNPTPAGDVYVMQTNMASVADIAAGRQLAKAPAAPGRPPADAPADPDDEDEQGARRDQLDAQVAGFRPAMAAAIDRVLRKEANAIRRKGASPQWAAEFYAEFGADLLAAVGPVGCGLASMTANVLGVAAVDATAAIAEWAETVTAHAAATVRATGAPPANHTPGALADAAIAAALAVYPEAQP